MEGIRPFSPQEARAITTFIGSFEINPHFADVFTPENIETFLRDHRSVEARQRQARYELKIKQPLDYTAAILREAEIPVEEQADLFLDQMQQHEESARRFAATLREPQFDKEDWAQEEIKKADEIQANRDILEGYIAGLRRERPQ